MFGVWPQFLNDQQAPLLQAVEAMGPIDSVSQLKVADVAGLRKHWPAEMVSAAIELVIARRRAAMKFSCAGRLIADIAGIEQSTSEDVARHKTMRYAELGIDRVVDMCCGIGGDALGLREVAEVYLVDRDGTRAWMARHNTGCEAAIADVTTLNLDDAAYHIDPDRRSGGRRSWSMADTQPPPAFLNELARRDGAMKLSPGVDLDELPRGEVEIIQRNGRLVAAVVWTGRLALHPRSATRIGSDGSSDSFYGQPDTPIPTGPAGRYLFAIDPAIERAGLLGAFCESLGLPMIHSAVGLLTGDKILPDSWVTAFELVESMPWRPKRVRQWLASHGAGIVEIKTRGQIIDPDKVQKFMRGKGDVPFTVFVLRMESRVVAMVTRRVA